MIPITLNEGSNNTVTIQAFDDEWSPNFDRITIHPILSEEEVTRIDGANPEHYGTYETHETYGGCYSIEGVRLSDIPTAGIFIKNGKKRLASSR